MHPKNKKVMTNTYTQIHIHTVLAVQNKDTFLTECVGNCVYRVLSSDAILADCYNNPLGMKHLVQKTNLPKAL